MKEGQLRGFPSRKVWKTVLAATLAWLVALWCGIEHPFFAPLSAVLCIQVTVEQSIRVGLQRVLGIIVGVLLAGFVLQFAGTHWWTLGLLLLIGLGLGEAFKFPEYVYEQIGTTVLLVLAIEAETGSFGWAHLIETVAGAGLAILINALLVPPDYTRKAQTSLIRAVSALSAHFRELSLWMQQGASPSRDGSIHQSAELLRYELMLAGQQMDQAMQALKFSPLLRARRQRLDHMRDLVTTLQSGYTHSMEIHRILLEYGGANTRQEQERLLWSRFFGRFAVWLQVWERKAALEDSFPDRSRLKSEMELPPLSPEHLGGALLRQAHQLVDNFSQLTREPDRMPTDTPVILGHISDGKGRGKELVKS